jgi:hypothetical protein
LTPKNISVVSMIDSTVVASQTVLRLSGNSALSIPTWDVPRQSSRLKLTFDHPLPTDMTFLAALVPVEAAVLQAYFVSPLVAAATWDGHPATIFSDRLIWHPELPSKVAPVFSPYSFRTIDGVTVRLLTNCTVDASYLSAYCVLPANFYNSLWRIYIGWAVALRESFATAGPVPFVLPASLSPLELVSIGSDPMTLSFPTVIGAAAGLRRFKVDPSTALRAPSNLDLALSMNSSQYEPSGIGGQFVDGRWTLPSVPEKPETLAVFYQNVYENLSTTNLAGGKISWVPQIKVFFGYERDEITVTIFLSSTYFASCLLCCCCCCYFCCFAEIKMPPCCNVQAHNSQGGPPRIH